MEAGGAGGAEVKIAILTNFKRMNPGYSLTGIVLDQARMLAAYDHEVHLFVSEKFDLVEAWPFDLPAGVTLRREVPAAPLIDYKHMEPLKPEGQVLADRTQAFLEGALSGFDAAFTHDWIYTGWNVPYGQGVKQAGPHLPEVRWFHWIHSVPANDRHWRRIREYKPIGNHKVVYPNKTDLPRVINKYRGGPEDVLAIHHVKDLRTFHDFSPETCEVIARVPGLLQAEVVQILPAGADRLHAKRAREVIQIFAALKSQGASVCLLIAAQHATTPERKTAIAGLEVWAVEQGLIVGQEVTFTCRLRPEWEIGIPKRMVRELFACSNLFIFPTKEETFGLVVPEAALAGCLLVLNESLPMQREVAGGRALFYHFGSHRQKYVIAAPEEYFAGIARDILDRMRRDLSISARDYARRRYNWDWLYHNEYLPMLEETRGN
ncbi:glycosyltransferase family 4 protein [Desulfatiglans anilini]|uniref:glycosyltransferase family 4 protein n=1 Tax=Desulfatiglans anilini TaxID=90728 RepID=UPI0005543B05|nr:glycosyltransferase family 4 protein [Desulfatiglans anilini]